MIMGAPGLVLSVPGAVLFRLPVATGSAGAVKMIMGFGGCWA